MVTFSHVDWACIHSRLIFIIFLVNTHSLTSASQIVRAHRHDDAKLFRFLFAKWTLVNVCLCVCHLRIEASTRQNSPEFNHLSRQSVVDTSTTRASRSYEAMLTSINICTFTKEWYIGRRGDFSRLPLVAVE